MSNCKIRRRKLVKQGTMSLNGSPIKWGKQEWKEEECGTPIFGKDSQQRKVCDSCLKGWTHENNFMLDIEENKTLLENERLRFC